MIDVYGQGVDKDERRAVRLARYACDHKAPFGCTLLGVLVIGGNGGTPSIATAATSEAGFQDACDREHELR